MNWIKKVFHFFGSIYLALGLIAASALFVIIGTILESRTDSHLLAARWTYHSPFFALLLWLFFINILFAALRRWPFKARHIPFLITHFGLLMIIGGTLLKNKIGLQGNLSVWEGSGSNKVLIPHTHALSIENIQQNYTILPIRFDKQELYQPAMFQDLSFKMLGYCPHVKEKIETWIKGDWAYISGHPPMQVNQWDDQKKQINFVQLPLQDDVKPWQVAAIKTDNLQELINYTYLQNLKIAISSKLNPENIIELPLEEIINRQILFDGGTLQAALSLSQTFAAQFDDPHIEIKWEEEPIKIYLQGNHSLYNLPAENNWLGTGRFQIDLKRDHPVLIIAEDQNEDIHLLSFDQFGRIHGETINNSSLPSLVVYDQGFGGYALQAELPYPPFKSGRMEKEDADRRILIEEIRQALESTPDLAPPLALFKNACIDADVDFVETFLDFLYQWQLSYQLLLPQTNHASPLNKAIEKFQWNTSQDKKACQWICQLFDRLEQPIRNGENLLKFLQNNKWPFLNSLNLSYEKSSDLLTLLSQQIFSISSQLPNAKGVNEKSRLLSAYFKAYNIDYRILQNAYNGEVENFDRLNAIAWKPTIIETSMSIKYKPHPAPVKLEDHHPCLLLEFRQGLHKEKIALAYQADGSSMKWPILNGQFVIRYQPEEFEIPYRIRLRQARQVQYPNSQQVYSYESDILISEAGKEPVEKTLSMNQVHETWDGYRFYLAGISQGEHLKRIQIIVNHDPAKYLLTYPGGAIVFLGIILLFWVRPYRRS